MKKVIQSQLTKLLALSMIVITFGSSTVSVWATETVDIEMSTEDDSDTNMIDVYTEEDVPILVDDAPIAQQLPSMEERRNRINAAPLNPMYTNNAEIDAYIDNLLSQITTPDMDTYTKVKACYDYLVHNWYYERVGYVILNNYPYYYTYQSDYDAMIVLQGYEALKANHGVCDNYAAAFVLLTRRIGLESYKVGGYIGKTADSKLGHAWVNIKINGQYYLFDPQVEDNVTKNGVINYYYFAVLDSETWSGYDYVNRDGNIASFRNFDTYSWETCSISPEGGQYFGQSSTITAKALGMTEPEYYVYYREVGDTEYILYDYGTANTYTIEFDYPAQYEIKIVAEDGWMSEVTKEFKYNVMDEAKVEGFISRLYNTCLQRTPDAGGMEFWKNYLLNAEHNAASVGYDFVFSEEYANKRVSDSEYIEMLYNVLMGRNSDQGGKQYWLNILGQGVSREYIYNEFAQSQEFQNICNDYGVAKGNIALTQPRDQNANLTMFVNRIYVKAMERSGEVDGLNYWCSVIQSKQMSPVQVAEWFFVSPEFVGKNLSNSAYVDRLYLTFMGRDADADGKAYWVGRLQSGESRESVLQSFAGCPEFQTIVQSFGL